MENATRTLRTAARAMRDEAECLGQGEERFFLAMATLLSTIADGANDVEVASAANSVALSFIGDAA